MGRGMRAHKKQRKPSAKDMQGQMAGIAAMQEEVNKVQQEIELKEIETTSGGGAVRVKVNGKKELLELEVDKDIATDDIEMLQDLVIAAVNEGMRQIDEITNNEMEKVTKGLGI